jgi:Prophage endopeptidase tail
VARFLIPPKEGDPNMMYVRDLAGNEYALQTTSTSNLELNGNQSLTFKVLPTKVNELFIDDISEMWIVVDHDDVEHRIVYCKKQGAGARPTVEVTAIPLFFDKFDTTRLYEEYNEHLTAQECFSIIFEGTGFDFVLVDSFNAVQWEGLGGGESRLESFKRALERYQAEFRIHGNTVYLESKIGRDTQIMYRYRLNASNISQEFDANAYYTYAKGYGDYEDGEVDEGGGWQNAKLIREYTSPLAAIVGIREAPPVKDGRITKVETMDERLKTLVDESLLISVSADVHDLRKQGYPVGQPQLGDRVFLIDERIGLHEEVRVVSMSVTRDWKGNVIDLGVVFGTPGVLKRYQSNLQTAVDSITDIVEGRRKLPMTVLDNAVIQATKDLQSVQTELKIPPNGGWMAVNKDDPNKIVVFNSAGIGISDDGGHTFKTAMTGSGIVADVITAGTLRGITVISDDGRGNTVTIENGSIYSKYNNRNMIEIHDYKTVFYDPGDEDPTPDYGEVGTLGATWYKDSSEFRGISLAGSKDYIAIARRISSDTTLNWAVFSFKERYTTIRGGDNDHDDGRLYLYSTTEGGTADRKVPRISILNYTDTASTPWSGVIVHTGRDNRSPANSNFRSGFEIWQYRGTRDGRVDQLVKIDTDSGGIKYASFYTDEIWLPRKAYIQTGEDSYYKAMAISIDPDVSNRVGSLENNALMHIDSWDFIVDSSRRYQSGRYTMSGAKRIFAVFIQPTGSNSVYYNARAYNISSSGFDVYVAKNDGSDTPSATTIRLQIIIIYEPS